jgi:uncharacterized protein YbjT (DUF2867 family)
VLPVVVTGADTPLGALVMDRLIGPGLDLRATVDRRDAVQPLVDRGVKTAVSDLVDTERFGAVLENAHTVIHLRGGGSGQMLSGIPDVIAALPDSGVERIVTLAPLTMPMHPSLDALRATGLDVVVLRVGVVLGRLSEPGAQRPKVLPRARPVAPLSAGDLAAAIVAADHLRDLHGYLEIDAVGRDIVTAAELDRLLGTRRGWLERWHDRGRHTGSAAYGPNGPVMLPLVGDRGAALEALLGVRPISLADAVAAAVR